MKLIMCLWVRNEEKIINENIFYHRACGIDHFIANDNGSTDRTTEILKSHEEKGYLTYFRSENNDYEQSKANLEMVRIAQKMFVNEQGWIFLNDADEFYYGRNYDLKQTIKDNAINSNINVITVSRYNMFFNQNCKYNDKNYKFYYNNIKYLKKGYRHKTKYDIGAFHKILNKVVVKLDGKISYIQEGNHNVEIANKRVKVANGMVIYHYPFREWEHFLYRIQMGVKHNKNNKGVRGKNEIYSIHKKNWNRLYHSNKENFKSETFGRWEFDENNLDTNAFEVDNTIKNFFVKKEA